MITCAEANEIFQNLCRTSCVVLHPCRTSFTRQKIREPQKPPKIFGKSIRFLIWFIPYEVTSKWSLFARYRENDYVLPTHSDTKIEAIVTNIIISVLSLYNLKAHLYNRQIIRPYNLRYVTYRMCSKRFFPKSIRRGELVFPRIECLWTKSATFVCWAYFVSKSSLNVVGNVSNKKSIANIEWFSRSIQVFV